MSTPMIFQLLWPEHRTVSDTTIRGWYSDAVANGEVESVGSEHPQDMADALHDAGLITLANQKIYHGHQPENFYVC